MSAESMYQAVRGRDARFDGEFFTAVVTTGIYCRPSCPAVTPKRENVRFYPTAAAAQGAGFRACRRCRPDAVPGSADWDVRADAVGRAMRLIADGVVDREGVAGLAARLGYSPRQVQRQLTAELGAGPVALARAQRAHTARVLLQTTELRAADVAFAAGFASVRQFNDTVRQVYGGTPSELRADRRAVRAAGSGTVPLRLALRAPYAAAEVFDWLARRALAGVEEVVAERGVRTYRRTLRLPHGWGIAEVREPRPVGTADPGRGGGGRAEAFDGSAPGAGGHGSAPGNRGTGGPAAQNWLDCRLRLADLRDLTAATQRLRRLFDLDADPWAVADRLGADPVLAPLVRTRPGLRSPGAADPHELAVRAVLGQQVSVAAGRTLGGALAAAYGEPLPVPSGGLTRLFPTAEALAEAPLGELGMPGARRSAIRTLAAALAAGTVRLDPGADRDAAEKALLALRGIGPWTSGYVRMRALGDPDVLLAGDSAVRAGARRVGASLLAAEPWRPWRSYAMHHLWLAAAPRPGRTDGMDGTDGMEGVDGMRDPHDTHDSEGTDR